MRLCLRCGNIRIAFNRCEDQTRQEQCTRTRVKGGNQKDTVGVSSAWDLHCCDNCTLHWLEFTLAYSGWFESIMMFYAWIIVPPRVEVVEQGAGTGISTEHLLGMSRSPTTRVQRDRLHELELSRPPPRGVLGGPVVPYDRGVRGGGRENCNSWNCRFARESNRFERRRMAMTEQRLKSFLFQVFFYSFKIQIKEMIKQKARLEHV